MNSKQHAVQSGPGLKPPSVPRKESAPNPQTGKNGSTQSHKRGKQGTG